MLVLGGSQGAQGINEGSPSRSRSRGALWVGGHGDPPSWPGAEAVRARYDATVLSCACPRSSLHRRHRRRAQAGRHRGRSRGSILAGGANCGRSCGNTHSLSVCYGQPPTQERQSLRRLVRQFSSPRPKQPPNGSPASSCDSEPMGPFGCAWRRHPMALGRPEAARAIAQDLLTLAATARSRVPTFGQEPI